MFSWLLLDNSSGVVERPLIVLGDDLVDDRSKVSDVLRMRTRSRLDPKSQTMLESRPQCHSYAHPLASTIAPSGGPCAALTAGWLHGFGKRDRKPPSRRVGRVPGIVSRAPCQPDASRLQALVSSRTFCTSFRSSINRSSYFKPKVR
jgi:hypothetical protein